MQVNNFQILGVAVVLVLTVLTLHARRRRKLSAAAAIFWVALWFAAGVAILRPELTVRLARAVGIDRGADLVFYCAILGMLIGFFMVFGRLRQLESHLTQVVRQLALMDRGGSRESEAGPEEPTSGGPIASG